MGSISISSDSKKMSMIMLCVLLISATSISGYTNHTVGGRSGWVFDSVTNSSATNYSSWASSQSFSLGDFLIFKTNSNQTVIQTYNQTVFNTCNTDDASDGDYFQYDGGVKEFGQQMTVAVPLTKEGLNYYLSNGDDGVQCMQGMAFAIDVKHGTGLPPSLNQVPPPLRMPEPNIGVRNETQYESGSGVRRAWGGVVVSVVVLGYFRKVGI